MDSNNFLDPANIPSVSISTPGDFLPHEEPQDPRSPLQQSLYYKYVDAAQDPRSVVPAQGPAYAPGEAERHPDTMERWMSPAEAASYVDRYGQFDEEAAAEGLGLDYRKASHDKKAEFDARGNLVHILTNTGHVLTRADLLETEEGRLLIEKEEEIYRNANKGVGFLDTLTDFKKTDLPIVGMLGEVGGSFRRASEVADIYRRLAKDRSEGRPGELTFDEVVKLQLYDDESYSDAGKDVGAIVGDIVRKAPSFVAEFWATGLVAGGLRSLAARGAVKAASASAGAAASNAKSVATWAVDSFAKKAAQEVGAKAVADAIAASPGAATGLSTIKIAEGFTQAQVESLVAKTAASIRPVVESSIGGFGASSELTGIVSMNLARDSVARSMSLAKGWRTLKSLRNSIVDHASSALLDWGPWNPAPASAIYGVNNSARAAFKDATFYLLMDAPIRGAINYAPVYGLSRGMAAAGLLGEGDDSPIVSRSELDLLRTAYHTGDKRLLEYAESIGFGIDLMEYVSENSGRGFSQIFRGAGLATRLSNKAGARLVQSANGLIPRELSGEAGNKLGALVRKSIGSFEDYAEKLGRNRLAVVTKEFERKGLKASEAEIRAYLASGSASAFRDRATMSYVASQSDFLGSAMKAAYDTDLEHQLYKSFFRYTLADFMVRHRLDGDSTCRLFKSFGYDGWFEEILEERYADIFKGLMGLDDKKVKWWEEKVGDWVPAMFNEMFGETTIDQLVAEAIGFAIPMVSRAVALKVTAAAGGSSELERVRAFSRNMAGILRGVTVTDVNYGAYYDGMTAAVRAAEAEAEAAQKEYDDSVAALGTAGASDATEKIAELGRIRDEKVRRAKASAEAVSSYLAKTIEANEGLEDLGEASKAVDEELSAALDDYNAAIAAGADAETAEKELGARMESAADGLEVLRSKRLLFAIAPEVSATGSSKYVPVYSDEQLKSIRAAQDAALADVPDIGRILYESRETGGRARDGSILNRVVGKITGIAAAIACGDPSLAQTDPAHWSVVDQGLPQDVTIALYNLYDRTVRDTRTKIRIERLDKAGAPGGSVVGSALPSYEDVRSRIEADGTYKKQARELLSHLLTLKSVRAFHQEDVPLRAIFHIAKMEGWTFDSETRTLSKDGKTLSLDEFPSRGDTPEEKERNKEEFDEACNRASAMAVAALVGVKGVFSLGAVQDKVVPYFNLPAGSPHEDRMAASIAGELLMIANPDDAYSVGRCNVVSGRELSEDFDVEDLLLEGSVMLPEHVYARVKALADPKNPDHTETWWESISDDDAQILANSLGWAEGADVSEASLSDRKRRLAAVVALYAAAEDDPSEVRHYGASLADVDGPTLGSGGVVQLIAYRIKKGPGGSDEWAIRLPANSEARANGKVGAIASYRKPITQLEADLAAAGFSRLESRVVLTPTMQITSKDPVLMLKKLGLAFHHVKSRTVGAGDSADYSRVHPLLRPIKGWTEEKALAEDRRLAALSSLYVKNGSSREDYNWGKKIPVDDPSYAATMDARKKQCEEAYNIRDGEDGYLEAIERDLVAAGVLTPRHPGKLNTVYGASVQLYSFATSDYSAFSRTANRYVTVDFANGADATSGLAACVLGRAIAKNAGILGREGSTSLGRQAVAFAQKVLDVATRTASKPGTPATMIKKLRALRTGLLNSDNITSSGTMSYLALAYTTGYLERIQKKGVKPNAMDDALLFIKDDVESTGEFIDFVSVVDLILGGDGFSRLADYRRSRVKGSPANPRGLDRLIQLMNGCEKKEHQATFSSIKPYGKSENDFIDAVESTSAMNRFRKEGTHRGSSSRKASHLGLVDFFKDLFDRVGLIQTDTDNAGGVEKLAAVLTAMTESVSDKNLKMDDGRYLNDVLGASVGQVINSALGECAAYRAAIENLTASIKASTERINALGEDNAEAKKEIAGLKKGILEQTKQLEEAKRGSRLATEQLVAEYLKVHDSKDSAGLEAIKEAIAERIGGRAAELIAAGVEARASQKGGNTAASTTIVETTEQVVQDEEKTPAIVRKPPSSRRNRRGRPGGASHHIDITLDPEGFSTLSSVYSRLDANGEPIIEVRQTEDEAADMSAQAINYFANIAVHAVSVSGAELRREDVKEFLLKLTGGRIGERDLDAILVQAALSDDTESDDPTARGDGADNENHTANDNCLADLNAEAYDNEVLKSVLLAANLVAPVARKNFYAFVEKLRENAKDLSKYNLVDEATAKYLDELLNPRSNMAFSSMADREAAYAKKVSQLVENTAKLDEVLSNLLRPDSTGAGFVSPSLAFFLLYLRSLKPGARANFLDLVCLSVQSGVVTVRSDSNGELYAENMSTRRNVATGQVTAGTFLPFVEMTTKRNADGTVDHFNLEPLAEAIRKARKAAIDARVVDNDAELLGVRCVKLVVKPLVGLLGREAPLLQALDSDMLRNGVRKGLAADNEDSRRTTGRIFDKIEASLTGKGEASSSPVRLADDLLIAAQECLDALGNLSRVMVGVTDGDEIRAAKAAAIRDAVAASFARGLPSDFGSPNKSASVSVAWHYVLNAYSSGMPETVVRANTLRDRNSKTASKKAMAARSVAPLIQAFFDRRWKVDGGYDEKSLAELMYQSWRTSDAFGQANIAAAGKTLTAEQAAEAAKALEAAKAELAAFDRRRKTLSEEMIWSDRVISKALGIPVGDITGERLKALVPALPRAIETWKKAGLPDSIADNPDYWRWRVAQELYLTDGNAVPSADELPVFAFDDALSGSPDDTVRDTPDGEPAPDVSEAEPAVHDANLGSLTRNYSDIVFLDTETHGLSPSDAFKTVNGKRLIDPANSGSVVQLTMHRYHVNSDGSLSEYVRTVDASGNETLGLVPLKKDSKGRYIFIDAARPGFDYRMKPRSGQSMDDVADKWSSHPKPAREYTVTNKDNDLLPADSRKKGAEAAARFLADLGGGKGMVIVAHNAAFDLDMMTAFSRRENQDLHRIISNADVLDTASVTRDRTAAVKSAKDAVGWARLTDDDTSPNAYKALANRRTVEDVDGKTVNIGATAAMRAYGAGKAAHDSDYDTALLVELTRSLAEENDDLSKYVNRYATHPYHGMAGRRVAGVGRSVGRSLKMLSYPSWFIREGNPTAVRTKNGGGNTLDRRRSFDEGFGLLIKSRNEGERRKLVDAVTDAEASASGASAGIEDAARAYFEANVLPGKLQTLTWANDVGSDVLVKNIDVDRDDREVQYACALRLRDVMYRWLFATEINPAEADSVAVSWEDSTLFIPIYHGEHSSGFILQVPARMFFDGSLSLDFRDLAKETFANEDEYGNKKIGDYLGKDEADESVLDKAFDKLATFFADAIGLDLIGTDTKRSALSSSEAPGHSMRSFDGDESAPQWGENRFHALINLGRDAIDNDGFLGTEVGYGYGYDVQALRAKNGKLKTKKVHLMGCDTERRHASMFKGLVDVVGESRPPTGSALAVVHEHLKKFREATKGRSTSTLVDRDSIKVGALVSTTFGIPMVKASGGAASSGPGSFEDGKRVIEEAVNAAIASGGRTHMMLFDFIHKKLLEHEGEISGTLSGEGLDKVLCDRYDEKGNPLADEDGKYRFWTVELVHGEPVAERKTIGEVLGEDEYDEAVGSAIQVNVVDGLHTDDEGGKTHKAFDFSFVDNTVMSYDVANVSHESYADDGKFAKNTAIDTLTFASLMSDKNGLAAGKVWLSNEASTIIRMAASWGVASSICASDPGTINSYRDSQAVRDLLDCGVNQEGEMVDDAVAYAAYKGLREAIALPQLHIRTPLVSAGAVYRKGRFIDHTKDPFLRYCNSGSWAFGTGSDRALKGIYGGAGRGFGYARVNARAQGFRYSWFVPGNSVKEQEQLLLATAEELRQFVEDSGLPVQIKEAEEVKRTRGKAVRTGLKEFDHLNVSETEYAINLIQEMVTLVRDVDEADDDGSVVEGARAILGKAFVNEFGVSVNDAVCPMGDLKASADASFSDLFLGDGFDRTAVDLVPCPADVAGQAGKATIMLGGTALGIPRTPSYNGSKWLQVVRATIPSFYASKEEEGDGFTPSRETKGMPSITAAVQPDAQTLAILGCDHDGDKADCYILGQGRSQFDDEEVLKVLDPLNDPYLNDEQNEDGKLSLDEWSRSAKAKQAYLLRLLEAGIVEQRQGRYQPSEAFRTYMNNKLVSALLDFAKNMPTTVDGLEQEETRTFLGTDFAYPTSPKPVSGEEWASLQSMANPAADYLKDKRRGVKDSEIGPNVGSSANLADSARGSSVSMASTAHLCKFSDAFPEVFDNFGGREVVKVDENGKPVLDANGLRQWVHSTTAMTLAEAWIKAIHLEDGIPNATFDDIKEQVCLKMGWTPGMMDSLYSAIFFEKGHMPTSEREMYEILRNYLLRIYDKDRKNGRPFGPGYMMMLASDPSEGGTRIFGIKAKDLLPISPSNAVLGPTGLLDDGDVEITMRWLHKTINLCLFGSHEAAPSRAKVVDRFGLKWNGKAFEFDEGAFSDTTLFEVADRKRLMAAFKAAIAANAHTSGLTTASILEAFVKTLPSRKGSNAIAGLVFYGIQNIRAASTEDEKNKVAQETAETLVRELWGSSKIHEMRNFANAINFLGADPGDAVKVARRANYVDDFNRVLTKQKRQRIGQAKVNELRRMLLANLCAYGVGSVQTRLGRVATAANESVWDASINSFATAVAHRPALLPAGRNLVMALMAAKKESPSDVLRLESNFQTTGYFLSALTSMPSDATGTDIMSGGHAWEVMRALAVARRKAVSAKPADVSEDEAEADTLSMHEAVIALFQGLYALASTSTYTKEIAGVLDFHARGRGPVTYTTSSGKKRKSKLASGFEANRRELSYLEGNSDGTSNNSGVERMKALFAADFGKNGVKRRSASLDGRVRVKAKSFLLSVSNLQDLLTEIVSDSSTTSKLAKELGKRVDSKTGRINFADESVMAKVRQLARAVGSARSVASDVAEAILVLEELRNQLGLSEDVVISPRALFEQYIPLYTTSCSRVTPANPTSRTVVDHIPGLVKRLTDEHARLDRTLNLSNGATEKGRRVFDLISACDLSVALTQGKSDDGTVRHMIPGNFTQKDADDIFRTVLNAKGEDGTVDLSETEEKLKQYTGEEGTLRLGGHDLHVIDVLNDGGLLTAAHEWITAVDERAPAPTPEEDDTLFSDAEESEEKIDTETGAPEYAVKFAKALSQSGVGTWAKIRVYMDGTIMLEGALGGAAAKAFGMAARAYGEGKGRKLDQAKLTPHGTKAVLRIKLGDGVPVDNLDPNSPFVISSFVESYNAMLRKAKAPSGDYLTAQKMMMLDESSRAAMIRAFAGAHGAQDSSLSLQHPLWTLGDDGVAALVGDIRVAGTEDFSAAFHEYFHAMYGMFRMMGTFSSADIAEFRKAFGEAPEGTGWDFNEEEAANWYMRRIAKIGGAPEWTSKASDPKSTRSGGIVTKIFTRIKQLLKIVSDMFKKPFSYAVDDPSVSMSHRKQVANRLFSMLAFGDASMSTEALEARGIAGSVRRHIKKSDSVGSAEAVSNEEAVRAMSASSFADRITFSSLFSDEIAAQERAARYSKSDTAARAVALIEERYRQNDSSVEGSKAYNEMVRLNDLISRTPKEDLAGVLNKEFASLSRRYGRNSVIVRRMTTWMHRYQEVAEAGGSEAVARARELERNFAAFDSELAYADELDYAARTLGLEDRKTEAGKFKDPMRGYNIFLDVENEAEYNRLKAAAKTDETAADLVGWADRIRELLDQVRSEGGTEGLSEEDKTLYVNYRFAQEATEALKAQLTLDHPNAHIVSGFIDGIVRARQGLLGVGNAVKESFFSYVNGMARDGYFNGINYLVGAHSDERGGEAEEAPFGIEGATDVKAAAAAAARAKLAELEDLDAMSGADRLGSSGRGYSSLEQAMALLLEGASAEDYQELLKLGDAAAEGFKTVEQRIAKLSAVKAEAARKEIRRRQKLAKDAAGVMASYYGVDLAGRNQEFKNAAYALILRAMPVIKARAAAARRTKDGLIRGKDVDLQRGKYRLKLSDVASAMFAAHRTPIGRNIEKVLHKIASTASDPKAPEHTVATCRFLYRALSTVAACVDETRMYVNDEVWDGAVSDFLSSVQAGISRDYNDETHEQGAFFELEATSDEAVQNQMMYALGGDITDGDGTLGKATRNRLIADAVNVVLIAAAQVKFARDVGITYGGVHSDSFTTEFDSFEDFLAATDACAISAKDLTSDSSAVETWSRPEFIAANLDEWLSSTLVPHFGTLRLKELFMKNSSALRSHMTALTMLSNYVNKVFGLDREPGKKLAQMYAQQATHIWDGGMFRSVNEGEETDEDGDLYSAFHSYDGLFSEEKIDAKLSLDEFRTLDLALKAVTVMVRGGRYLLTGIDDISFGKGSLMCAASPEDVGGEMHRRSRKLTKADLTPEAIQKRFGMLNREAVSAMEASDDEAFRQMTRLEFALFRLDQQWHRGILGPAGINLRKRFIDTVFDAYEKMEAGGFFGGDDAMVNDYVISRLEAEGIAVGTSEDDNLKRPSSIEGVDRRLSTKCVLAFDVREVKDMYDRSSAKKKLIDEAGRDEKDVDLTRIAEAFRKRYLELTAEVSRNPWLTAGDARYLNNFGTPLQGFVGHGMFMAKAVRSARDRKKDEIMRIERHELTFDSMIHNPALMSRPYDSMTANMANMIHDFFNTPEDGTRLIQAIGRGEYEAGSKKSLDTGFVADGLSSVSDIAQALYRRVLEVRIAKMEGRNIYEVNASEGAIGRIAASYEKAAMTGANLVGTGGLTDEQAYKINGVLPSSLTIGASVMASTQGLQNALYFRSTLVSMMMTPGQDGNPLYLADPSDNATELGGVPDEVWSTVAKWWSKKLVASGVKDAFYDITESGVANASRIYKAVISKCKEGSKWNLFGFKYKEIPRDTMDTVSINSLLCRADDADDPNSSALNATTGERWWKFDGSEAYGYARQLMQTSRSLGVSAVAKGCNRLLSWSKSMSVALSAFFPLATKWESPTAAVGGIATILSNGVRPLGLSPETARRHAAAVNRLMGFMRGNGWVDEDFIGFRDIVDMMESNDPFIVDLIQWAESLGVTMTTRSNDTLVQGRGVVRDDAYAFAEKAGKWLGGQKWVEDAIKGLFDVAVDRQSERAFTYAMNATKLAVVAQLALKLQWEARKAGKAFDCRRDMAGIAEYADSEVGGVHSLRYAWAHPQMRSCLNIFMFSWQWTRTAWEAAGGGVLEDIFFGGHAISRQQRRITFARWCRMYGEIMFGVPVVLQFMCKLIGCLFGINDPDDKWFTWENDSKIGTVAASIRPLLKVLAQVDETLGRAIVREVQDRLDPLRVPEAWELHYAVGPEAEKNPGGYDAKEAKRLYDELLESVKAGDEEKARSLRRELYRANDRRKPDASYDTVRARRKEWVPEGPIARSKRGENGLAMQLLCGIIPLYTGRKDEVVAAHIGKQGWEAVRWATHPFVQAESKMSRLAHLPIDLLFGGNLTGYGDPYTARPENQTGIGRIIERMVSIDERNGFLSAIVAPFKPFSISGITSNPDAGALSAAMPIVKGSSYYRIYSEVCEAERKRIENGPYYKGSLVAQNGRIQMRDSMAALGRIRRDAHLAGFSDDDVEAMRKNYISRELVPAHLKELFTCLSASGSINMRKVRQEFRTLIAAGCDVESIANKVVKKYQDAYEKKPTLFERDLVRGLTALETVVKDPFGGMDY